MPYDVSDYFPQSPEEQNQPSLDQMRLALTKRPLDVATDTLKRVATEYNPLMLGKAFQDVAGTFTKPVVAAARGVGASLFTSPPGTYTSGQAPAYAAQVAKEYLEKPENQPQTPMGQAFAEGLSKAAETAKIPHMWPLAPRPAGARPFITPNDVRVMGAEATRVGRQVRDIPTDFASAQSGLTRLDPVTGAPTMGARLQGAAADVGRIAEQRRSAGLGPIPGVPDVIIPETQMYAVRPAGTRITVPEVPPTKSARDLSIGTAIPRAIEPVTSRELSPTDIDERITLAISAANLPLEPAAAYVAQVAQSMYPDAPSPAAAVEAFRARFSESSDRTAAELKLFDEFLKTPEAHEAGYDVIPSSADMLARDKAAREWLQGPLINYMRKHVGAVGDPLVELAKKGLTYLPTEDIKETTRDLTASTHGAIARARREAGLPEVTPIGMELNAAGEQLNAAQQQLREIETRRAEYADIAMRQGVDPATIPEFAALTNPRNVLRDTEIPRLEKQLEQLSTAKAYEDISDYAVKATKPADVLERMEYSERQFYPSVTRARPEETIYTARREIGALGFDKLARDFYQDVMTGKIPLEQVPKMTVEKYTRGKATARIAEEKRAEELKANYKQHAEENMLATLNNMRRSGFAKDFGNASVIELSQATGLSAADMTKVVSEATAVLDHCIAQGGKPSAIMPKNPWANNSSRTYHPIYDPATGEFTQGGRNLSSYAESTARGNTIIADVRNATTGVPVATLELVKSGIASDGQQTYNINYASGFRNGAVDKQYTDAIKDYLNSRSDSINSAGSNLAEHIGIYDMHALSPTKLQSLSGAPRNQLVDFSEMPRFVTQQDLRYHAENVLGLQEQAQVPARRPATGQINYDELQRDAYNILDDVLEEFVGSDPPTPAIRALENEFRRLRNDFLSEYEPFTRERFDALRQHVGLIETEWANSRSASRQDAAEVMGELRSQLDDIFEQHERHATAQTERIRDINRAEQARIDAQRAQAQAETPYAVVAGIDDFINNLRETESTAFGDRVDNILRSTAQNELGMTAAAAIRSAPERLAEVLETVAQAQMQDRIHGPPDGELVAQALTRIVQMLRTPAVAPVAQARTFGDVDFDNYVADVRQHVDAQVAHDIVRISNTVADALGTNVRGALENQPTEFAQRLADQAELAENGLLEVALRELADHIAPRVPAQPGGTAEHAESLNRALFDPDTNNLRAVLHAISDPPNPFWAQMDPLSRRMAIEQIQEELRMRDAMGEELANLEPDVGHPANLPQFDPAAMAQDLFAQTGGITDIESTLYALDTRMFDDPRFRALPDNAQEEAHDAVARELRRIIGDRGIALSPNTLILMPRQALIQYIDPQAWDTLNQHVDTLARDHSDSLPHLVAQDIRNDRFPDVTEGLNPYEREIVARDTEDAIRLAQGNQPLTPAEAEGVAAVNEYAAAVRQEEPEQLRTAPIRRIPRDVLDLDDQQLFMRTSQAERDATYNAASELINANPHPNELRTIMTLIRNHRMGNWEEFSDTQRAMLINHLADYIADLPGQQGLAQGGLVRGYQEGGSVGFPPFYKAQNEAILRSQEMYPGEDTQDNKADAARHLLAAGYMTKSFGPKVAKGLGWAHEASEAPIRTIGHALGLSNPRYDYAMDMHNNTLGAQLAQQATNRNDFERRVKSAIDQGVTTTTPGRVRLMTPEQAKAGRGIRQYANGGTVSHAPSLDDMKLELLMRSK